MKRGLARMQPTRSATLRVRLMRTVTEIIKSELLPAVGALHNTSHSPIVGCSIRPKSKRIVKLIPDASC